MSAGVIWRTTRLNMLIGAVVGFLYGPIAQLALVAIEVLERTVKNESNASKVDPGVLFVALVYACVSGLLCGASIGLLGGIFAGVIAALVIVGKVIQPQSQYRLLCVTSAIIGGLVTFVLMTLINLPDRLAYLGADWVTIGWILMIAVPTLLISVVFWQVSRQVIKEWQVGHGAQV
jgi:hypothetical protein